MNVWAVVTGRRKYDLESQIIEHTEAAAKREVKDLRKNYGIDDARVKMFASEDECYAWIEANQ